MILLVQVPVEVPLIDGAAAVREDALITDHLERYCSKLDPLPAISVVVDGDVIRVVRGHQYLVVARRLGRPVIRAVVLSPPERDDVKRFLSRSDVVVLDWEAIRALEERNPNPVNPHVFFFARPLSLAEKASFDAEVRVLFSDASVEISHSDAGPLAEFRTRTPVTNEVWIGQSLNTFLKFSREQVPIISYQGRRFMVGV